MIRTPIELPTEHGDVRNIWSGCALIAFCFMILTVFA
jgi:hypothetical protein